VVSRSGRRSTVQALRKSYIFSDLDIHIIVVHLILTITSLVISHRRTHQTHLTPEGTAYGGPAVTRRMQWCRFDPMMSAWKKEECVFDKLIEHAGDIFTNWNWFSDVDLTQQILGKDLDVLRAGNYSKVWTSHSNTHEFHYVYMPRRVAMALRYDLPLADTSNACHHTNHCAASPEEVLQCKAIPEKPGSFEFPLMYHTCAVLKYII
jgi:hypothetical protein